MDRLEKLREEIVEAWHAGAFGERSLEDVLHMTPAEYGKWLHGAQALEEMPVTAQVDVWIDGSCPKPEGPGGWAYITLLDGQVRTQASGGCFTTTNNRMELVAAIEGVRSARCFSKKFTVWCDSQYVVYGMTKWRGDWERRGWHKVKNLPYWTALLGVSDGLDIDWRWVRGHAGVRWNEAADGLAGEAAAAYTVKLPGQAQLSS